MLVLDGVTDPHNLGACLRSAAAAKVTAVIVPKDRAVGLTPVVRRASAGGADRVPLIAVTNLARTLRELKDAGVWITGLAGDTDTSIYGVDFKGPVLVLGSEGEGIPPAHSRVVRFRGEDPDAGHDGKPQRLRRHRRGAVRGATREPTR
ncbi:23S rRNA (guanosine-2'-O-)-methyltransferase RlmB [Rhodanobacter lindaniclasticus]